VVILFQAQAFFGMMKNTIVASLLFASFIIYNPPSEASSEISTYIYNGTTASTGSSGDWPSIASLYYDAVDYSGLYGLYCGATILDNQHVLTAAHCLYDGNGSLNEDYLVYTSIVPQMDNESQFLDGSVDVIRASEFYVNSGFDDSSYSDKTSWPNDIAIIKLEEPMNIDTTDYVTRADETDATSYRVDEEEFIAVGHGYTETGDGEELLQTTLNYEPAASCDLGVISSSQLCMTGDYDSDTEVRNSTCSGDSGGPLYWYDDSGVYVQAGITSYGWTGCYNASSDDTSVFTEVADYEEWISNVLAGSVTPDFTISDEERDAYYSSSSDSDSDTSSTSDSDSTVSTSSSSGGSINIITLLLLLLLQTNRRATRIVAKRISTFFR